MKVLTSSSSLFFIFAVVIGALSLVSTPGCYYDIEDQLYRVQVCDTVSVTYSGFIAPLFDQECIVCHSSTARLGNVVLEPHNEVLPYVNNQVLMCTVKQDGGCSPMPQNAAKLTDCQIASLQKWISDGAPNN